MSNSESNRIFQKINFQKLKTTVRFFEIQLNEQIKQLLKLLNLQFKIFFQNGTHKYPFDSAKLHLSDEVHGDESVGHREIDQHLEAIIQDA